MGPHGLQNPNQIEVVYTPREYGVPKCDGSFSDIEMVGPVYRGGVKAIFEEYLKMAKLAKNGRKFIFAQKLPTSKPR